MKTALLVVKLETNVGATLDRTVFLSNALSNLSKSSLRTSVCFKVVKSFSDHSLEKSSPKSRGSSELEQLASLTCGLCFCCNCYSV